MKRPSLKTRCVADRYASPGERIAEFAFPDGTGGLLSMRQVGGEPVIEVYRVNGTVRVRGGSGNASFDMIAAGDQA